MLFNSYEFVLAFLPIVLIGFYLLGRARLRELAIGWLVVSSLFFYGWWNPQYLWLIGGSIIFNFALGTGIVRRGPGTAEAKAIATVGVVANLSLLGYFKYAVFVVGNINLATGADWQIPPIVLPLAISFFTFQQISFLVDTYKGEAREYNFLHYCLFVTFFPQLIAGPIVHHKEMLPQFARPGLFSLDHERIAVGMTIFLMGLFKKVVLADGIAVYATPVFNAAESGVTLTFIEAWGGVLAYTFQIYFDFSGYSDMAIGLARMFGVHLPLNFDSPYKAASISEFWRRWHMTLSRFLRDYVYIPLGGNRKGPSRQHVNLMTVMLVGGLWHGAGWTFVVWGGLHGLYLVINHFWTAFTSTRFSASLRTHPIWTMSATVVTFLAVVFAWVFFRAESFEGANAVLAGMLGMNGLSIPQQHLQTLNAFWGLGDVLSQAGVRFVETPYFIGFGPGLHLLALLVICWFLPNTQQIMARHMPAVITAAGQGAGLAVALLRWQPGYLHALLMVAAGLYSLTSMTGISEFLYFQF